MAKLSTHDLEKILFATLTGMTVDTFNAEDKKWTEEAKDGRWKRPYSASSKSVTNRSMRTSPPTTMSSRPTTLELIGNCARSGLFFFQRIDEDDSPDAQTPRRCPLWVKS